MRDYWRTTALVGSMVLGLAVSSANAQTKLSETDQDFIETAAQSGAAEVAMGKTASESKNTAVAEFGKMMISEHTQMNEELAGIAKQKGVEPPSSPDLASQAKDAAMNVLPGSTFDKQYVSSQLDDHQETLQLLQQQAQEGQDTELKAFAQKYIPVVEKHIDQLNQLKSQPELQ
jgi:putative membrane protein